MGILRANTTIGGYQAVHFGNLASSVQTIDGLLINYNMTVTASDANGNPTGINYKRTDGTLYKKVTSSNPDANFNYRTIVEQNYAANGTTLLSTATWTLVYDVNGNVTSRTVS